MRAEAFPQVRKVGLLRIGVAAASMLVSSLTIENVASASSQDTLPDGAATPTECAAGTNLEGCYGFDDMEKVATYSYTLVDTAVKSIYKNIPRPNVVNYIPVGEKEDTSCTDSKGIAVQANDTSFFYCPQDIEIYMGQKTLWDFYQEGDAAPVFAFAHEYGHHIQRQVGVPTPIGPKQTIVQENQADCMGGAILRELDQQGKLNYDDLGDIDKIAAVIASKPGITPDGELRDHGTVAERVESIIEGFTEGMEACNLYTPETPVIAFGTQP